MREILAKDLWKSYILVKLQIFKLHFPSSNELPRRYLLRIFPAFYELWDVAYPTSDILNVFDMLK